MGNQDSNPLTGKSVAAIEMSGNRFVARPQSRPTRQYREWCAARHSQPEVYGSGVKRGSAIANRLQSRYR